MLEIEFPFDQATPLLGIYPNDFISYFRDTCSIMFIVSLFSIARKETQPGGLLTDIE